MSIGRRLAQAVMILVVVLCACDRGVSYRPMDWSEVSGLGWQKAFGMAEFRVGTLGGFLGSRITVLETIVTNRSDLLYIRVKSAILRTGRGLYTAEFDTNPLVPREVRRMGFVWHLTDPIRDVLIPPVEVRIAIQIGEEESEIALPMERSN